MSAEPFVIERTFNAPVQKVWKAITNKAEMKKWYFDLAEFMPVEGFEFQFYGGEPGKKQYLHLCRITEVIEGKKLSHSWRYDGYEGESFVTWELFEENNKTRVKLTHDGLETFPAIPEFAKENFVKGWNSILDITLKGYLENV